MSDKTDFKPKMVMRDKDSHYIISRPIYQDVTIRKIYVPNIRAPQYIKIILTDLKRELYSPPISPKHTHTQNKS